MSIFDSPKLTAAKNDIPCIYLSGKHCWLNLILHALHKMPKVSEEKQTFYFSNTVDMTRDPLCMEHSEMCCMSEALFPSFIKMF